VRRLAAPTVLIACAATLFAAPNAAAKLQLPPGADAPPELPAGVVVAESPELATVGGQGGLMASAARSGKDEPADGDTGGRPFWATVNICDTQKSPNALGVRASVPGNGSKQRIFARYTAQWWSAAKEQWLPVGGSGITKWIFVGNADMSSRQAGWTFHFVQPPEGKTYVMRGVVQFQWRGRPRVARKHQRRLEQVRKGRKNKQAQASRGRRHRKANASRGRRRQPRKARTAVVRERTLLTETGVKHVQGGDPAGLSKAMCLIW
jgi:hypothetical protein